VRSGSLVRRRQLARTLREHQADILPFIETRLTNATGEGINRLLQMVKQRASGFANLDAFTETQWLTIAGEVPRYPF
jgi:transposase